MSQNKNRMGSSDVIKQFIIKHGDKYDYSSVIYNGDNKKIKILCATHGYFEQTPSNHKRGQKCPKCQGRNLTNYELLSEFRNIHGEKYNYIIPKTFKNSDKIVIECKSHGNFTQTINNHKNGQGCKKCAGLEKPTMLKLINDFKKVHGEVYDYSKVIYISAHKKIIIKCLKHGDFKQTPNNHKNGNGCPTCNESLGEKKIRFFLESFNINYLPQYKFNDCKNKLKLPFDFYLPNFNVCIEFNGIQHYKVVEHFGGIDGFNSRKINDKIKREYCLLNNIPLIIIKYNDNISDKLTYSKVV